MANNQTFNLKKIDDNKFEYINRKGQTVYFNLEQINKYAASGRILIIDGKQYQPNKPSTAPATAPAVQSAPAQNPTSSTNTENEISNFATTDEINFQFGNRTVGKSVIIANLKNKVRISVNNREITLAANGMDYVYVDQIQQMVYDFTTQDNINYLLAGNSKKRQDVIKFLLEGKKVAVNGQQVKLTKDQANFEYILNPEPEIKSNAISEENVKSIISSSPDDTSPVIFLKIKTTPDGRYMFQGREQPKFKLINTLKNGKHITIDGKIAELNADQTDFIIREPEKPKTETKKSVPSVFNIFTVDENKFSLPERNQDLSTSQIIHNLKRGVSFVLDGKPIRLKPDKSGWCFADEYAKLVKDIKPIDKVQEELAKSDVEIINTKRNHLSYFGSYGKIDEDPKKEKVEEAVTDSYTHMKDLQKRLFLLSSDSNMINLSAEKSDSTFDFCDFINKYEKHNPKQTNLFKRLLAGEPIFFNFNSNSQGMKDLWNKVLKFNSIVQDTKKELGGDYLSLAYPCIKGTVIDPTDKEQKPLPFTAPLFFVSGKLVVSSKDKHVSVILQREKQQLWFRPNTELLLYLGTKLGKQINLTKYKNLFEASFQDKDTLVSLISSFFKELGTTINSNLVLECTDKYTYELINKDSKEKTNDSKQKKTSKSKKSKEEELEESEPASISFGLNFSKSEQFVDEQPEEKAADPAVNNNSSEKLTQEILPAAFLGVFKTLNSDIFKDYDRILKETSGKEYYGSLESLIPNQLQYYVDKGVDFKETEIKQVVELDYSQKVACSLAMKGSINIVGPAGTGKSQTISNILANLIDKNENTLFVAEKKTATDVVFNRLSSLRYYCLPLFDKENWNETLTKALRQTLKRVGQLYGSWETLNLDGESSPDKEKNKKKRINHSEKLDEQFAQMKEFRELMSTDEGYLLPQLQINFSTPEKHQMIKDMTNWVSSIFDNSENSEQFWSQINQVKIDKKLYEGCHAMLLSINDKEIRDNKDLQNRFLKICKYYDSPTLFDSEMPIILQAPEFNTVPIDDKVKISADSDELKEYKSTNYMYKKFQTILISKRQAYEETLKAIKDYNGFVTVELLDGIYQKHFNKPQIQQGQMMMNNGQMMSNGNNQFMPNGQQMMNNGQMMSNGNGQFGQNGQPMMPNNNGQFAQNNQFDPQNQQMMNNGQMMQNGNVQFGQNGQQMMNNGQPMMPNNNGQFMPNNQQMFGQNGQQMMNNGQYIQQQPEKSQSELTEMFAEKYNIHTFIFEDVKQYQLLTRDWTQQHSKLLHLDASAWFNATKKLLDQKLTEDTHAAEVNFLKIVRNELNSDLDLKKQYNELYGIVDNKDKLDNVEETLMKYGAIIALLYPVVIASPNLVCKYIDPIPGLFKHVVIDEASMLSLEKAIPILYRGQKFCIVGDNKQLQPLSYLEQLRKLDVYKKLFYEDKISKDDLVQQQGLVNTYKGLLDFIAPHIQKTTLQYHYRAVKKELVRFSSIAFYDNEMITANNYSNPKDFVQCGVFVKQVDGDYKNGVNQKECLALYNYLEKIANLNKQVLDVSRKVSVGIIVFSNAQKDYLNNLIAEKANPDVLNMQFMYNQETGEDSSLFIKDVESVQGDERDIILMSLGSSSKSKAEIIPSFGLLNTSLGPNFLNVMTTRARKRIVIFKSFKADDVPDTGNSAITYYRDFIKYIDLLAVRDPDKTKSQIDNLFKEYILRSATIDYSTLNLNGKTEYLCKELFDKFSKHIDHNKYKVVKNYQSLDNQTFGLVAINKETDVPQFALIFDDFIQNLYKTAKQSEFYDYLFLHSRGWNMNKVTALEWSNLVDRTQDNIEISNFIKEKLTFTDNKNNKTCYYIEESPENNIVDIDAAKQELDEINLCMLDDDYKPPRKANSVISNPTKKVVSKSKQSQEPTDATKEVKTTKVKTKSSVKPTTKKTKKASAKKAPKEVVTKTVTKTTIKKTLTKKPAKKGKK